MTAKCVGEPPSPAPRTVCYLKLLTIRLTLQSCHWRGNVFWTSGEG